MEILWNFSFYTIDQMFRFVRVCNRRIHYKRFYSSRRSLIATTFLAFKEKESLWEMGYRHYSYSIVTTNHHRYLYCQGKTWNRHIFYTVTKLWIFAQIYIFIHLSCFTNCIFN